MILCRFCLLLALVVTAPTLLLASEIRLAVTTSFNNSGLSDLLLPEIKNDLGIDVRLLVVGTGQALKLGKAGDVDAILVHSKKAEEAFVTAGYGIHRRQIMYNDFVLVGPASDPAEIRFKQTVVEALQAIEATRPLFVSRGDDSGTHRMELSLWKNAGLSTGDFSGDWYRATGSGMGAALNTASAMNAYLLSDRASWLNFGNKGELTLLFSGDASLFNQYSYIPINKTLHPHVNSKSAEALEQWLTSEHGQQLIGSHTINGEKLFVPNAVAGSQ